MKQKKKLLRQFSQNNEPRNRYQVEKKDGFYYAYEEDGGGQDWGPTHFGVFVSEEEARACLRKQQKGHIDKKKSKHRKK